MSSRTHSFQRSIALHRYSSSDSPVEVVVLFPRNLLARESLGSLQDRLERDYIVYHFRRLEGSAAALCEFLKLSRRQLYRRCQRLWISLREERKRR